MLKSLNSGGSLPGQFRNLQLKLIDQALQLRGLGPGDALCGHRGLRPRMGGARLICKCLGPGKKLLLFGRKVFARLGKLSKDRITRML